MSHGEAYREGRITLRQYRRAQGLKLAASRARGKRKVIILKRYKRYERSIGAG